MDEALHRFSSRIVVPGLVHLEWLGGPPCADSAVRLLLAIARQESGAALRYQRTGTLSTAGPARGFWQFERAGGVLGVMKHQRTALLAHQVCDDALVDWDSHAIWRALEGHDGLAVAFARLLLLSDPLPLPKTEGESWSYYLRNWRPGKPHPESWAGHWGAANAISVGACG